MCNIFGELNCDQTITISWDEHLENLVYIQLLYCKRNTFSFRNHDRGIMTLNKQTNTFFLHENRNQTLVILRNLHTCRLNHL